MTQIGKTRTFAETAWILGLALLCSFAALRPLPLNRVLDMPWGDTLDHSVTPQGAAEGLQEGQFPLREIPKVFLRIPPVYQRLAYYQFYGNLPLTLAGLITLGGLAPWQAWAVLCYLAFFAGFLGLFRLARDAGLNDEPSLAAAAVYTLAPYHLVALFLKGAVIEVAVFGLLPWVFLFSFRAAKYPRASATALSGLAWAGLMHTHHVFHLWTLVLLALALGLGKALNRKASFSLPRAALGYGLGLALSAWFVFPGALVGPHFLRFLNPMTLLSGYGFFPLLDLEILLSHVWIGAKLGLNEGGFNPCHVGWPILAGVVWAVAARKKEALRSPFFWLFLVSVLLAWGPFVYWKIAGPLRMIQTKFRLLIYTCLFGSVLCGLALAGLNRFWGRAVVVFLILFQAWFHAPYQSSAFMPDGIKELAQNAATRGVLLNHLPYDYVIPSPEADKMDPKSELAPASPSGWSSASFDGGLEIMGRPGAVRATIETGRWTKVRLSKVEPGSLALLPAPWYPGLYQMEINGKAVEYGRVGNQLAARLPPGEVDLRYRLSGYAWANGISLAAWAALLALGIFLAAWGRWLKIPVGVALALLCLSGPLRAGGAEFDYCMAGGDLAASTQAFEEAGRWYRESLRIAPDDASRSLALSCGALADLDGGRARGLAPILAQAGDLAGKSRDRQAMAHFLAAWAEWSLRQGNLEQARAANEEALKSAGQFSEPLYDRLCLQHSVILEKQGRAPEAARFLEESWTSRVYNPDTLYFRKPRDLGLATQACLDLRQVDKALVLGSIYATEEALFLRPCPDPVLKGEWGVAQICRLSGRYKAAAVFYEHALARHLKIFGPGDPGTRRLERLGAAMRQEAQR